MAKTRVPSPRTAGYIKSLASQGLQRPSKLTAPQVRELAGSVMSHIEPRANNTTVCKPTPKPPSRKR
jgi:hypothetical protein